MPPQYIHHQMYKWHQCTDTIKGINATCVQRPSRALRICCTPVLKLGRGAGRASRAYIAMSTAHLIRTPSCMPTLCGKPGGPDCRNSRTRYILRMHRFTKNHERKSCVDSQIVLFQKLSSGNIQCRERFAECCPDPAGRLFYTAADMFLKIQIHLRKGE